MPCQEGKSHFPNPATRRAHLQVVNVWVWGQTDLTPTSGAYAGMDPLLTGQPVPMIGERVTPDDSPDLRDS